MISINLLPEELRPIKRTPVPYLACAGLFAMAVLFCAIVFIGNAATIRGKNMELANYQTELEGLRGVVAEYNDLTVKKRQLAQQVKTINEISSDRIIWSRQLFNLGRLAPENMWYDTISVESKPFTETKKVYNPKTKTMDSKTVRINKPVLTVAGYVVPGKQGKASISPFTLITESDDEFSNLFRLDRSTFKDTLFDDIGVREFKLEYLIDRGGVEQ
jgi:hypothetical protein